MNATYLLCMTSTSDILYAPVYANVYRIMFYR